MKIAILTTDNREPYKEYHKSAPWFGTAPEALLQGFAQLPEVEVHVISCIRRPVYSSEKLADNVWFHSLVVPQTGWMRTLFQGCIRAMRKKLCEIRPDIVHGQGTEADCSLGAIFSGFPNVVTIHGNMRMIARLNRDHPFSYQWLAARLEGFTLPRTDGVVCITKYTREAVAGLAKKTWVVPNAVDESFFGVQLQKNREQPPVILCVGVVCLRKNQNAFIRALDSLVAKRRFKVIFLGKATASETYTDEFFELIRTRPWCEHIGFVDREKLKAHLRGATVLALPSLEDNCPMTVLEASAAGVPVVAANVGGVPDLVEDGKTGLLCDPLQAASMSGAVEKLLEQPELGRTLAAEARLGAEARFYPKVVARHHLKIYEEVLKKR